MTTEEFEKYDDSVAISSPGQLPFDMPMELLLSPMHASRPRNRLIAQASTTWVSLGITDAASSASRKSATATATRSLNADR